MTAQFASRLALIAFAAATVRGLLEGTDFRGTLTGALMALAVFFGLGLILGELARRLAEETARAEFARMMAHRSEAGDDRTTTPT